jgi:hypothetical protein
LGGAVGLQHRSGRQALRGSAVRPRARLRLRGRAGASRLALVGRFKKAATRLTTSTFAIIKADPRLGRRAARATRCSLT